MQCHLHVADRWTGAKLAIQDKIPFHLNVFPSYLSTYLKLAIQDKITFDVGTDFSFYFQPDKAYLKRLKEKKKMRHEVVSSFI
jgi:hypothetical protein